MERIYHCSLNGSKKTMVQSDGDGGNQSFLISDQKGKKRNHQQGRPRRRDVAKTVPEDGRGLGGRLSSVAGEKSIRGF